MQKPCGFTHSCTSCFIVLLKVVPANTGVLRNFISSIFRQKKEENEYGRLILGQAAL